DIAGRGLEPQWYAADEIGRDHVLLYPVLQGEQDLDALPQDPDLPLDDRFLTLAACYVAEASIGGIAGKAQQIFFTFGLHEPALAYAGHQRLLRQGLAARLRSRQPAMRQRVYSIDVTSADALRRFSEIVGLPVALPEGRTRRGRLAVDDRYLYLPVLSARTL